jgi:hypothetical protein
MQSSSVSVNALLGADTLPALSTALSTNVLLPSTP